MLKKIAKHFNCSRYLRKQCSVNFSNIPEPTSSFQMDKIFTLPNNKSILPYDPYTRNLVYEILNCIQSKKHTTLFLRKFMLIDANMISDDNFYTIINLGLELLKKIKNTDINLYFVSLSIMQLKITDKYKYVNNPIATYYTNHIENIIKTVINTNKTNIPLYFEYCDKTNDYYIKFRTYLNLLSKQNPELILLKIDTIIYDIFKNPSFLAIACMIKFFLQFNNLIFFTLASNLTIQKPYYLLLPLQWNLGYIDPEYEVELNKMCVSLMHNYHDMDINSIFLVYTSFLKADKDEYLYIIEKFSNAYFLKLVSSFKHYKHYELEGIASNYKYRMYFLNIFKYITSLPMLEKKGIKISLTRYKILHQLIISCREEICNFTLAKKILVFIPFIEYKKAIILLEVFFMICKQQNSFFIFLINFYIPLHKMPSKLLREVKKEFSSSQVSIIDNIYKAEINPDVPINVNFNIHNIINLEHFTENQRNDYLSRFYEYIDKKMYIHRRLETIDSLRIISYYKHDKKGFNEIIDILEDRKVTYLNVSGLINRIFIKEFIIDDERFEILWRLVNLGNTTLKALNEFLNIVVGLRQICFIFPEKSTNCAKIISNAINNSQILLDKGSFEAYHIFLSSLRFFDHDFELDNETIKLYNKHLEEYDDEYVNNDFIRKYLIVIIRKLNKQEALSEENKKRYSDILNNKHKDKQRTLLQMLETAEKDSERNIITHNYADFTLYNLSYDDFSEDRKTNLKLEFNNSTYDDAEVEEE